MGIKVNIGEYRVRYVMQRVVMKFGGTSVEHIEHIRRIAQYVKREMDAGNKVSVVVSAMAGETDRLSRLGEMMTPKSENIREYDVIMATGEQVSVGLLTLALQNIGINARSWLGWQLPIRTTDVYGVARIVDINVDRVNQQLEDNIVAVIAGFQGVDDNHRVTTLGRGGSDTSAVAMAIALQADRCDIYTDVDGVFTADPNMISEARCLSHISYEEMFELSSLGATVLHPRAVELAMKYDIPLRVLSSFGDPNTEISENKLVGTLVCREEEFMEKAIVSGITYACNQAKITLQQVEDHPGVAASIFGLLSDAMINIDMIVQNMSLDGRYTDITFTVPNEELSHVVDVIESSNHLIKYHACKTISDLTKVSIVGVGMRSHIGIAQKMFAVLAEQNINIHVISTSQIKVSVLIDTPHIQSVIQKLHVAYDMNKYL